MKKYYHVTVFTKDGDMRTCSLKLSEYNKIRDILKEKDTYYASVSIKSISKIGYELIFGK